jgi:hypothetical protein
MDRQTHTGLLGLNSGQYRMCRSEFYEIMKSFAASCFPETTSNQGGKMSPVAQRFRLNIPSMGTLIQDGKKIVFQIPAGSEILAVDPIPDQLSKDLLRKVNIQWQGKTMTMFLVDVQERGTPIQAAQGGL